MYNWINKLSAYIIEYIDEEYINISIYSPLFGSTYFELPDKLKHIMKGLNNIKNNGNNCFLSCHMGHLNPLNGNIQRITKIDKTMANDLDYKGIEFPV